MSALPTLDDPLADLIPRKTSTSERADQWAGLFMKLTLILVFVDIGFFAGFLLAESELINNKHIDTIVTFWTIPAIATVCGLGATCVAGLFKLSHEISR